MGGGQSTRKVTLDNDEPVGVIRVSENVANRLKTASKEGSVSNTSANPHSQLPVGHTNPNMNYQQPAGAIYMPQPYITSTMVREQVERELEKNDFYWRNRLKGIQDNQNKIAHVMEAEFYKAYKEVESNFPSADKDSTVPCQDYKSLIVDCFKNNANHTLNCSKVVNEFTSCIRNSRSKKHNETRSP